MFVLLLIHFATALLIAVFRRSIGRWAFVVAAIGPALLATWLVANARTVLGGDQLLESVSWVPALDLSFDLLIDGYAFLFLTVIAGAGLAIFLFARNYFTASPRVATFAAAMTLFAGAMVGLVASDHLLALFVFWELTTVSSYLLIGHDDHKASARSAALHAALVTGAGGLAMLGGIVLLGTESGTYLLSEIVASPPAASGPVTVAWVLILVGAVTKSAQFPFHAWLPGAMAAPTPASAFLHSATMVKAGIFLVGRVGGAASATTEWWTPAVISIGLATMVLGGWQALRQHDLKLLLAHGTLSQLGFMFLLMGSGVPELQFGAIAVLLAHALFKAALFLVVGTIDHEAGTRDLRRLTGLRSSMPRLFWVALAASASMAALPLTLGFAAKEAAFDGLVGYNGVLIVAVTLASVLTVAYTGRFMVGAFGAHDANAEPAYGPHRAPVGLLAGPAALMLVSVVLGLAPSLAFELVEPASVSISGVEKASKLVLWPGLVPALGFSLASLVAGSLLVWRSTILDRALVAVGTATKRLPTALGIYRWSVPALVRFADRSSGLLQSGSLPAYLSIILMVAVAAPATATLTGSPSFLVPNNGTALEWVFGGLVVAFAVALAFVRRRFAVVILLGGVGYGIAGLYSVLGDPDLTLTQLLVETLTIALFAFVLRSLPSAFTGPATARLPRLLIAAVVGAFVFGAGLVVNASRTSETVSATFLEEAVPEAAGANVVNVILVDFRGFDTLGEITVIVAAALGVAGLVRPVLRKMKEAS